MVSARGVLNVYNAHVMADQVTQNRNAFLTIE